MSRFKPGCCREFICHVIAINPIRPLPNLNPVCPKWERRVRETREGKLCPKCWGIPEFPEYHQKGCLHCDFHGTKEGFEQMLIFQREAYLAAEESWKEHRAYIAAGVCRSCGACSLKEAESKCQPYRDYCDEWTCAGEGLWEGQEE